MFQIPIFFIVGIASLIIACSSLHENTASHSPSQPSQPKELLIKAAPSEDPADAQKIFGNIEIFPKNPTELPYRAVRFRVQLFKAPHNEIISEQLTNSNGAFEFKVELESQYYLRIYTNQNKALEAFHGPFKAKDAISISVQKK